VRPAFQILGSLLAFALTLVLLLAAAPTSALAHPSSFPDVNEGSQAHDGIEFMTAAGVISGFKDGTFHPGDTLTRGQATKVLVLWQNVELVKPSTASFPDLDDVYRDYVETACAQGWITGFDDGRFRPYSTLSRQQMAIIMVRAMGWDAEAKKLSATKIQETLSTFSDGVEIASVARPYVALAVQRGLFGGNGHGRFAPRDGITRAQFALVVFRAELSLRAVIQEVRFAADYPDKTRVVIDLSRAPGKVSAAVSADGTLTINFQGGAIAGTLSQTCATPEVKSVGARQFAYDPRTVRVTLSLARYETFRVMSLAPSEGKGYRLVADVYKRTDGPVGDGPPLICIDPGHGGEAPGAIGVSGTPEKAVNLAIALPLAANLRKAGLKVVMTREDDRSVGLQERADIANAACASLFVSVHNNAASSDARGTETFYAGTPDSYSTEGKLLAEAIQRNLLEALGTIDRGARTHWNRLVVLHETDMPAALAEVGFMTNAEEEAKLLSPAYQQAAAQAIAEGVLEYLKWSTTVYTSE
jgi:N-acetylmuramoyl-L-alanine amidase